MATQSDLTVLLDMGFAKERAELAVKRSGGLQGALEWLEQTQDQPLDELLSAASTTDQASDAAAAEEQSAQSLVCNDCGKQFRNQAQAEYHASKSGHVDFSESTEELAPLTEEQKKEKLEALRNRLAEKRAGQSQQDKLDQKRNEEIRRKSTKETQDLKEDLQKKEQIKQAAAKRREKQDDIDAKERIRRKIQEDRENRRRKAEAEKAEREGRFPPAETIAAPAPTASGPTTSKPASAYTETRLRLQTSSGNVMKSFPVDTTLFEVASMLASESGINAQAFVQNFPKKTYDQVDFGATLKELGLVPSASLIVQ